MANRYYIPPRHSILDLAQLGLRLYSMKQTGEAARATQKIDRERLKLSKEEHDLRVRTQEGRERESRAELGGSQVPVTLRRRAPGQQPSPQPQRGFQTAQSQPGWRELDRNVLERRNELTQLQMAINDTRSITDKPPTANQIAAVKARIVWHDKRYGGNTQKVLATLISEIDESYPQTSSWNLFNYIDNQIKSDAPRIRRELQEHMDKMAEKDFRDSRIPVLAQHQEDLLNGKWIRRNMTKSADRELFEKQARDVQRDLATAQKLGAEARIITAQRGPTERLYPTENGYKPRQEAIGLKRERKLKDRAVKTWITPTKEVVHLPNNVLPPKGSKPYSTAGELEKRLTKTQELTSIRQDKATLKREINQIRGLPNLKVYQVQKARLPLLEDELQDLIAREKELLGKSSRKAKTPYKTAKDVKAAYKARKISKARAAQILRDQFGME